MDLLTLKIKNQKYTYVDSIHFENKKYVVYMDNENIYVSECIKGETLLFKDVSDVIYEKVIEVLHL